MRTELAFLPVSSNCSSLVDIRTSGYATVPKSSQHLLGRSLEIITVRRNRDADIFFLLPAKSRESANYASGLLDTFALMFSIDERNVSVLIHRLLTSSLRRLMMNIIPGR